MNSHCIIQLNPSILVVTPNGKGEAIGWMDDRKDDDRLWIVFLQKNGECWIYPTPSNTGVSEYHVWANARHFNRSIKQIYQRAACGPISNG